MIGVIVAVVGSILVFVALAMIVARSRYMAILRKRNAAPYSSFRSERGISLSKLESKQLVLAMTSRRKRPATAGEQVELVTDKNAEISGLLEILEDDLIEKTPLGLVYRGVWQQGVSAWLAKQNF